MKNEAISSQKLIHLRKQRLSFVHLHELNLERSAEKSFWKACCISAPIIPIYSDPSITTSLPQLYSPSHSRASVWTTRVSCRAF